MRNEVTPGGSSTPKCPHTSTGTISQPLEKRYKVNLAVEKLMNMDSSACSSLESDSESLFSQE